VAAVAELEAVPLSAEPADPSEWATPPGPVPPDRIPPPDAPSPLGRDQVSAAVRAVHAGLWAAVRSDDLQPLEAEQVGKIADGLLPLALRAPALAAALRWLAVPDPDSGLVLWASLEARAHRELLPEPVGTGAREPDGWVSRLAAWIAKLGARRAMVAPDRRAGTDG
jgi:hypothetical protein